MGHDVPIDPPEIDPAKFYCVTVNAYWGGPPPFECNQIHSAQIKCCVTGLAVQAWIDGGFDCTAFTELCDQLGATSQKLINISDPFDIFLDCFNNCV